MSDIPGHVHDIHSCAYLEPRSGPVSVGARLVLLCSFGGAATMLSPGSRLMLPGNDWQLLSYRLLLPSCHGPSSGFMSMQACMLLLQAQCTRRWAGNLKHQHRTKVNKSRQLYEQSRSSHDIHHRSPA